MTTNEPPIPTTPAGWAALYREQGVPDDLAVLLVGSLDPTWEGDVIAEDDPPAETIGRAAARDLITRVAVGSETLAAALAQLRRSDP